MADPADIAADRSAEGPLLVYFHGAPGSPREIGLIVSAAKRRGLSPVCQHRALLQPTLAGDAYFDALAGDLRRMAAGRKLDLIGFSIGAFVALQVSRRLGSQVRGVDLVSPAGPLELAGKLDDMAGGAVFRLAQRSPGLFRLASSLQGLMAALWPKALYRLLFAHPAGDDVALAADSRFKTLLTAVLKDSLGRGLAGYVRDVAAYVRPWADGLAEVRAPVRIWQGALDNWAPPAMAQSLRRLLPGATPVEMLPGCSHYSALVVAAPLILLKLSAEAASDRQGGGD